MTTSNDGLALIREFEGYRDAAYPDPSGVWTIGYGHTSGVRPGDTCTKPQAMEWLREDVGDAERAVNSYGLDLRQHQFDALVSLVYNIGAGNFGRSSLLSLIMQDASPRPEVEKSFKSFVYSGGVALEGLARRREREYSMYKGFFLCGQSE